MVVETRLLRLTSRLSDGFVCPGGRGGNHGVSCTCDGAGASAAVSDYRRRSSSVRLSLINLAAKRDQPDALVLISPFTAIFRAMPRL